MQKSYYNNSINSFLEEDIDSIFGKLSKKHSHALEPLQKEAWKKQIEILKRITQSLDAGNIYFEFSIPRMGKRVDNIIIVKDLILLLEFKIGSSEYPKHDQNQTIDYCLDLVNFHEGSHDKKVIPILIATNAKNKSSDILNSTNLEKCVLCNEENLETIISEVIEVLSSETTINIEEWENSIYKPTPTIIEAAQALYKNHSVEEISRNDAGRDNLSKTSEIINDVIKYSKENNKKSICFITGVPGAGKTLAGLNIANERLKIDEDEHSVFLSGNGPLVEVLREALTRDTMKNENVKRGEAERKAKTFIQNIHHFRDDNLDSQIAPTEKVVVFDEAQRAWQKKEVSNFMKRKKGKENFDMSEPEYLISVMDKHKDWCCIICLIGGGQEINRGEAGVSEWFDSLKNRFKDWEVYYSDKILQENVYITDEDLIKWVESNGKKKSDLHLSVSIRSFRSEKVAFLVQNILDNNDIKSFEIYKSIKDSFPIYLTRDIKLAKNWLQKVSKGTERTGIIASSGAKRLRSEGISVKNTISAADWFLNDEDDIRSSYYLEDIATEFDIQGLEIDYTCVAWDINMYHDGKWNFQNFVGARWNRMNDLKQKYLLNSYRVLLTRARQGMIIFVPEVDDSDWTRPKKLYDSTFEYFKSCGFDILE
ncbi:DUF2075 domain-containing protein [Chryseobacterium indoltheticum]|uniref:DUF2075 domain-containing protein n=1 Tax=Chryseobacterium indoltheticum TaxID=254 RepID=UPI0040425730